MAKHNSTLPLQIKMVPSAHQGRNLRSELTKEEWDTLRTQCYMKANYTCEICGSKGATHPVECHEDWEYNLKKKLQILKALQAVCPMCHKVIHIGRAFKTGFGEQALKHHRKVNKIKKTTQERIITEAREEWERCEKVFFKLDISLAHELLADFKSAEYLPDDMSNLFK